MSFSEWDIQTVLIVFGTIWCATFLLFCATNRNDTCNIISQSNSNKKAHYNLLEKILILLAYLLVVLVAGLQISNSDYATYQRLYEWKYSTEFNLVQLEFLYRLINRIVYLIFDEYQYVPLIVSAITNYFVFRNVIYYSRLSKIRAHHVLFIYLSVFYLVSFGMIRQIAAVNIVIFSIRYILKKEYIKYLFWTFIALGFHSTAIFSLILVAYAIINSKSQNKKILTRVLVIVGFYVAVVFSQQILELFSVLANRTESGSYDMYLAPETIGFGNIVMRIPLILFLICFKKSIKSSPNIVKYFSSVLVLEIFIVFTYYVMPMLGGRFQYYVLFGYAILIPYCIQSLFNQKKSIDCRAITSISVYTFGSYYMISLMLTTEWVTAPLMPIKFASLW